jgi:ppGpp synthetase/RelA/SpoT-type nucleotidyltranferase
MAKRLKRTPSIINKLKRLKGKLQLTTMNDIAGCRVILSNKKKVYKLKKLLLQKTDFKLRKDYIETPRESGYRSLHLIGKFSKIKINIM